MVSLIECSEHFSRCDKGEFEPGKPTLAGTEPVLLAGDISSRLEAVVSVSWRASDQAGLTSS